ncbi:hypothetical protein FACS189468_1530 [Spirochaetia bacterium]|nr:hypothetical protein FACS189468_1530 [Spirochaetia bacterium]
MFAAIVLLALSLSFVGCGGGDTEYIQLPGDYAMPENAVRATTPAGLAGLYADTTISNIYIVGDTLLPDGSVVPAGNNLYVRLATGTVASKDIKVQAGATLTFFDNTGASTLTFAAKKLGIGGRVNIENGVTIIDGTDLTAITSLGDADAFGNDTVVGTNKLVIGKGATLSLPVGDLAATTTTDKLTPAQAWAAAGQGDLIVADITNADIGLAALNVNTGNDGKRKFTITQISSNVIPTGTSPSLTIYGNTDVTTNGDNLILDTITDLTVDGKFVSTSTGLDLGELLRLTVNGTASFSAGTLDKIASIKVGAGGNLTVGGSIAGTVTGTTLTIGRNGTASLAGTPILGTSSIAEGGYLTLTGAADFLDGARMSVAPGTKVNTIEFPVAASLSAASSAGATLASIVV